MTGKRVIRTKKRVEAEKEQVRTAAELADRITTSSASVGDMAHDLSETEVKALIDHTYQMQQTAKNIDETVSQVKSVLKAWAEGNDTKQVDGFRSGAMKIGAKTTTTTKGATALVRLLKKYNKVKAADTILGVKITEAKKYLGEAVLNEENFIESSTDPFGTCSLVELKKKKK